MKAFIRITICLAAIFLADQPGLAGPRKTNPNRSAAPQPFTYANIVSYFKSTGLRPTEIQKRCVIFFEGEFKSPDIYNYCVIMVENSDEDVQVTFYLTDAHEMNWVTEFLDGSFFTRRETERLFELVNADREVRGRKIGRFRVDYHHWEPRHAQIIVFSFTPLTPRAKAGR
jgi:hypothetical protein